MTRSRQIRRRYRALNSGDATPKADAPAAALGLSVPPAE
jgi:hypothetical protein